MPTSILAPIAGDAVEASAATLARAFADGPWARWVVDGDDREDRLRGLYAIYLRIAAELGEAWASDDGAVVSAWTATASAADQQRLLERTGLGADIARLSGAAVANAARGAALMAPHAPPGDHWRLEAIGVEPARQGRGLGSAHLAAALARFDERGATTALETSLPRNVALYQRLGYRVRAELEMPDGGPPVWVMWRAPGATAGGASR